MAKRSPSYDEDSTLPCDMYLIEGWYGSKTHVMSTSPPLLQKCGTLYPVWLKGRLTLKLNYEHRNYIKSFCVPIIAFVKNGKKEQLNFFYISSIFFHIFYEFLLNQCLHFIFKNLLIDTMYIMDKTHTLGQIIKCCHFKMASLNLL